MPPEDVDLCTLVIKEYRDVLVEQIADGTEDNALVSLAIVQLPAGMNPEQVARQVTEIVTNLDEIPPWKLLDTRRYTSFGAWGSAQDLLLSIYGGAAEAITSIVVTRIARWTRDAIHGRARNSTTQPFAPSEIEVFEYLKKHFVAQGRLRALEIVIERNHARFVVEDGNRNQYLVEMTDCEIPRLHVTRLPPVV